MICIAVIAYTIGMLWTATYLWNENDWVSYFKEVTPGIEISKNGILFIIMCVSAIWPTLLIFRTINKTK